MQTPQPKNTPTTATLADLKHTQPHFQILNNKTREGIVLAQRSINIYSSVPGNLLISQLNCFLEMLVQLRSRDTGCRRMIPLSMSGVMEVQRLRSIFVQSLLSQHLDIRKKDLHFKIISFNGLYIFVQQYLSWIIWLYLA